MTNCQRIIESTIMKGRKFNNIRDDVLWAPDKKSQDPLQKKLRIMEEAFPSENPRGLGIFGKVKSKIYFGIRNTLNLVEQSSINYNNRHVLFDGSKLSENDRNHLARVGSLFNYCFEKSFQLEF